MYRITVLSGVAYAVSIEDIMDLQYDEDELGAIRILISEGSPVIFCEDLEDLKDFGIVKEDVKIVNE